MHVCTYVPCLLTTKTTNELLRPLQLLCTDINICLQLSLLLHVDVELLLEVGQLVLHLLQVGSLCFQVLHGYVQLCLGLLQLGLLGSNNFGNSITRKYGSLNDIHIQMYLYMYKVVTHKYYVLVLEIGCNFQINYQCMVTD